MRITLVKKTIKRVAVLCLVLLLLAVLVLPLMPPLTRQVLAADAVSINLSTVSSSTTGSFSGYTVEWVTATNGRASASTGVVTITQSGTYHITGSMTGSVVVKADCTLVLDNVTIQAGKLATSSGVKVDGVYKQASPYTANTSIGTAALSIQGNAVCTVQLQGSSKLTGYTATTTLLNTAAISVENSISSTKSGGIVTAQTKNLATLILQGPGTLTATGGGQSSAIGGGVNRATGNIYIQSGTINAIGGDWAPGIGDGDSYKSTGTDLLTWSCADPTNTKPLAENKGDTDGDGAVDTCQPATISITGGTVVAKAGQSTPGIGTSDELSGESDTTKNGSGIKNRIWNGLSILIDGGTIITLGGNNNLTSVGAGRYTIMSPGCITINKGTEQNPTRLIGISLAAGYTVNNSGMTADQNSPDISADSTANVFCFKYPSGMAPSGISFTNVLQIDDAEVAFLNETLHGSHVKGYTIYGLAVVLPDGTYKVVYEDKTLGEVVLEGGGMIYGDATKAVYAVTLQVNLDGNTWENHGKSYVLLKNNTGSNYLTTFAVGNGTYRVYELVDGNRIDTGLDAVVDGKPAAVTLDHYTVTFMDGETQLKSQVVFKGKAATAPTSPTKTGYVFTGWDRGYSNISNPTVVRAGWAPIAYTVRFNSNYPAGYTEAAARHTQGFVYDTQQALTTNSFAVPGYTFKGWSTTAAALYDYTAGTGVLWQYTDGQPVLNLASASNAMVDLYAVWEQNNVSVATSVTIDYSYYATQPGETEPGLIHIIEGTQETNVPFVLWRTDPTTGITTQVAQQPKEFVYAESVTEPETGMLLNTVQHSFEGLPSTNAAGAPYIYFLTAEATNYGSRHLDESRLHVRLSFVPDSFEVPFEVSLAETLAALGADVRPAEVFVKVVYRSHTEADWTSYNTADSGGIISQHGDSRKITDGSSYVVAAWDEASQSYTGSYSVWQYGPEKGEDGAPLMFDYHIALVGYKLAGGDVVPAGSAGFLASYADASTWTDWASDRTTQWVHYDEASQTASGVMQATLDVQSYTINYVYKDDERDPVDGKPLTPSSYVYGVGADFPLATRSHYTFGGWHSAAPTEGVFDETTRSSGVSDTQTGDVTVYAKWLPKEYAVHYVVDDKGQALASDSFVYTDGLDALPEPTPDETLGVGYVFDGWYADDTLKGDPVTSIDAYDTTLQDTGVTLHAKWVPLVYEVAFHPNNAAASGEAMANQPFIYGDAAQALTANTYAAAGYTFLGWALAPDATTVVLTDALEVQNLTTTPDDVVHLYGVWKLGGWVTVDSTYNNGANVVNESERPAGVTVWLTRRLPGEENYLSVDSVALTLAKTNMAVAGYEFATANGAGGVQMAQADGTLYEYAVSASLKNYDTSYDWRQDGRQNNGRLDVLLNFNPQNFDVVFEIDATDIYEARLAGVSVNLPPVINLKILYRGFLRGESDTPIDHTSAAAVPQDDAGATIITQHTDATITGKWQLTEDGRYLYTGSYPVWKDQDTGKEVWDYDYHIQLVSFVAVPGWPEEFALVAYGDDWVYYDETQDTASGPMTASLQVAYGIEYELDSGDFAGDDIPPTAYLFGSALAQDKVPTPERTGFDFAAWYTQAADENGVFDEANLFTGVASTQVGKLVLHAKWTPKTYRILYELTDASNQNTGTLADAPKSYTFTVGLSAQDMPVPASKDVDYTFGGWYTQADFAEGTLIESIETNHSGDITLYAKWDYDPQPGGNEPGDNEPGDNVPTNSESVTPDSSAENNNGLTGGTSVPAEVGTTDNTVLPEATSSSEAASRPTGGGSATIVYDLNGGEGTAPGSQRVSNGSLAAAVPSPARPGYIFLGWNTKPNGSGTMWDFAAMKPRGDMTLYAIWEQNTGMPAEVAGNAASGIPSGTVGGAGAIVVSQGAASWPSEASSADVNLGGRWNMPPLFGYTPSHWALLNLVLAALSCVCALVFCLSAARRHKQDEIQDETRQYTHKRRWWPRAFAALLAVLSVLVFVLTENTSLMMAIADAWTPVMLAALVCVLLLWMLGDKTREQSKATKAQQAQ